MCEVLSLSPVYYIQEFDDHGNSRQRLNKHKIKAAQTSHNLIVGLFVHLFVLPNKQKSFFPLSLSPPLHMIHVYINERINFLG